MRKKKTARWNANEGAALNAKRELPPLAAAYFARVRETLGHRPKPSDLHKLRLLSKRLRYTVELFRPCYGPGLRERIAALRRIQQCLGELNDCVTAKTIVARHSSKGSPVRDKFDRFMDQQRQSKIEQFRREWAEQFDAPGKERWWMDYLARYARAPSRTR